MFYTYHKKIEFIRSVILPGKKEKTKKQTKEYGGANCFSWNGLIDLMRGLG